MNLDAYNAVRHDPNGAGVDARQRAWLKLTGADRQTFLNGQITNDVLYLQPGQGVHACLLNNTGHMLANLYVQSTPDALWIEVTRSRAEFVKSTLERYLIREKVLIEDVSDAHDTLTVQGQGARRIVSALLQNELPESAALPLSNTFAAVNLPEAMGAEAMVMQRPHTPSSSGFDIMLPAGVGPAALVTLLGTPGAVELDWETLQTLRIEAGIPKWGSELTETTIPLEANLGATINQNKGCYMGQEVIARILSRGHTNRTLVGFRLSQSAAVDMELQADEGPQRNQSPARLTSVTESPECGSIALGFIRNEYAQLGLALHSADGGLTATVSALPFVA